MSTIYYKTDNPLAQGIKVVGIGKKGSKALEPGLISKIIDFWHDPAAPISAKGAFIGGLLMKGPDPQEAKMLQQLNIPTDNQEAIIEYLEHAAPSKIKNICLKLMNKEELNTSDATTLGDFLFSALPGDGLRGLAASILRVRYETADEYEGLLRSVSKTFNAMLTNTFSRNTPIVQIAEPFDGVDHSQMITPLVADYLQHQHYTAVCLAGRNSGPKIVFNLLDIAEGLGADFLTDSKQLSQKNDAYGYFLRQSDLSQAMDRWVDIRRMIIKRPFLATIERFVNPIRADILIASAFHPPYGEKMMTIAERAGFKASIIIRNGIEGTLGFALLRATKVLISVQKADGTFKRHEFDFDSQAILNHTVTVEEKLEHPSAAANISLIQKYKKTGTSGNALFDLRVKATCAGIQQGIDWINKERVS